MREGEARQPALFSYVSLEERVLKRYPLRKLRVLVDSILALMSSEFDKVYSGTGRPSIPPERLLRALWQVLFSVRRERILVEQMEYSLLVSWFVGFGMDKRVFDATVVNHNRERLLTERCSREFFGWVKTLAQWRKLMSEELVTVNDSLIEARAATMSFRPKDSDRGGDGDAERNPSSNLHGEKRSSQTHESATDPETRLYRKGESVPAKLSYMSRLLTGNRNGLIAEFGLTAATGTAEREAALAMLERAKVKSGATVATDTSSGTRHFVAALRQRSWQPNVAQNTSNRRNAIDGRTTRPSGSRVSQRRCKLVEEAFRWVGTIGSLRRDCRIPCGSL